MPAVQHTVEDLKGPDNDRTQTIDYVVQRIAWISMLAILVAAVLGLFGQGLLSERHIAADDQSLQVTYQAIDRYEAPTALRLRIPKVSQSAGRLRVLISKQFADNITAESISPAPIASSLQGDDVVYEFAVKDITDAEIIFRHKHDEAGWLRYNVSIEGHLPVSVRQYILP